MNPPLDPLESGCRTYEFRVRGHLCDTVRHAFPGLRASVRGGDAILTGSLPDRSALHGVLARIESLGLELLELHSVGVPLPPSPDDKRAPGSSHPHWTTPTHPFEGDSP